LLHVKIFLPQKAMVALYFGRIHIRLRVSEFQVFRIFDFASVNLMLVFKSHQAETIDVKRLIQERNNATRAGELTQNYGHLLKTAVCTI